MFLYGIIFNITWIPLLLTLFPLYYTTNGVIKPPWRDSWAKFSPPQYRHIPGIYPPANFLASVVSGFVMHGDKMSQGVAAAAIAAILCVTSSTSDTCDPLYVDGLVYEYRSVGLL